ncbi:fasciclin domain-containing protein, partial [bacterium]|nr:fasciclin domain-containing protein [bacterium]
MNVFEIVSNSSSTSHMVQIAVNFDLASTFQESEDVSLFAPSDAAIESYATELGMDLETFLTSDQAFELIQYHLTIGETVLFSEWENGNSIITALGTSMSLTFNSVNQFANNTAMVAADFIASNGVVHLTDGVIMPVNTVSEWLSASPSHNYANIALENSGLVEEFEELGTLTFFAPTDAAILDYIDANNMTIVDLLYGDGLEDFIRIHWVENSLIAALDLQEGVIVEASSGDALYVAIGANGEVNVNNAQVQSADILIHNGMVHTIDAVIQPTYFLSDALEDQELTILTTLLDAMGLLETLDTPGAMTLFAPTDSALLTFLDLAGLELADVLADTEGTTEGLLYHLTQGLFMASDLEDGMSLTMASGESLQVSHIGDSIYVANGLVVGADFETDNGYLHIVDAVLLPPVEGCMDDTACNYDSEAVLDDGSCYSLDVTYEITHNVCVDGMDGTNEIQTIGIESGLSFSLDAYGGMDPIVNSTGSFDALEAGEYGVMVTDSLGCSTSWTVDITSPDGDPLVLNTNITGNDGSLEITGGSEPYSVTWYVLGTLEVVAPEDLVAGDYLVVVIDALGCEVSDEVNIEPISDVFDAEVLSMTLFPNPAEDVIQIGNMDVGFKSIDVIHSSGQTA